MANEFIARKGLIALENSQITGSLEVSSSINGMIIKTVGDDGGVIKLSSDTANTSVSIGHYDTTATRNISIGEVESQQTNAVQIGGRRVGGGQGSISIGDSAQHNHTTADSIGIGTNANRFSNGDIGIGKNVLYNDGGTFNSAGTIAIGHQAGYNQDGTQNVILGSAAGRSSIGENSVYLGHSAGYYASGSGVVLLGYQAGYNLTGSNQLIIANTGSKHLIRGDFEAETLEITGSLDITSTLSLPGISDVSASLATATAGGGTITGVTAGDGLTGGGSAGSVTLNVVGGTGVTANANDIAIGQDVATTADVQFANITSSGNISSSGTITGNSLVGTLSTAAQANITSLGTLTSLTVDDITINGSTISDGADLTIDAEGDITLDANGADVILSDDGTEFGRFKRDNSDFVIKSATNNKDIVFRGVDDSTTITALTLDMSDAGKAIFAGNISASSNIIGNEITSSGAVNIGGILSIPGFDNVSASLATATAGGGTITGVTAGDGLTGGGSAGSVTLNVVGGTGVTANANDIAIGQDVAITADVQFANITSSGNISSSGKVTSDTLDVDGFVSLGGVDSIVNNSGTITFGNNSNVTQIRSSEDVSVPGITTANVTASSNISSSGTGSFAHLNLPGFNFDSEASTTELIVEGNITASGDISSSGTIVMLTASIGGGIFTSAALAGGGGGGATTLSGLSDVNITSIADGDLIRYNGTAGEWQNTNLGLTVTPIISFANESFAAAEITITNSASYDDPSIFCQIKSGSTVVVPNSSMSFNESTGKITYNDVGTEATRSIELRVQDFGDLQSELVTGSYIKKDANFRYWRLIYNAESSNSHTYLKDFRLYDDVNQSGTGYPSNMTSNVLPSPYSASGNYIYNSTYDYFKAFDNNAGSGWWTIGSNTTGKFINIDFGTAQNIKSVYIRFNQSYYVVTNLSVIGSNNADYSDSVAFIDSASVSNTQTPTLEIEIN